MRGTGLKSCDQINQAGIEKKSFELVFHDGQIWCEHLDGMGVCEDEVIKKFIGDINSFSRPSISSFMIINLDETVISERIAEIIITGLLETKKRSEKSRLSELISTGTGHSVL